MFPEWLRNGPQVKLPKTRTTGLGPTSFRQGDLGLAVVGLQGEVGRGLVELGPGLERADLLPEEPADEGCLRWPAGGSTWLAERVE